LTLAHVISHLAEPAFDFTCLSLTRDLITGDISYDTAELDGLLASRGTSTARLDASFGDRWLAELLEALYLHQRDAGREQDPLMDEVLATEDALQAEDRLGCRMRG
jgi:hypothetical protein